LDGTANRHPGNRVEGEQWRVCCRPVLGELHTVDVKDAMADPVVAPGVWFVAVIAKAEAPPFRLFLRRQPLGRVGRTSRW
jgi:hypothetical protein